MHPAEVALGAIGISLDRAWQTTLGRDDVVIAVLDSGIRWNQADLRRKIWLNAGELPVPLGSASHDANGDGVFDVDDYAGDPRVGDPNGNGLLDAQDLIAAFSDCRDDDGNGYPDDIAGWDATGGDHCGFVGGDNDADDTTSFGHGSGIAATAAAESNNALLDVGVCPRCRVLPVRVGDSFVVDANDFARGLTYAVHAGARVVASALGAYNNTPAARTAVDLAYERGVTLVASAADEFSYHHNFPSVYNRAIYVNAMRFDHATDWRQASTFWGLNPCTNFGARVSVSMPAVSCSSGATSRLAGVVGLIQSAALDGGQGLLHPEEVFQLVRATADDLDNSEPDWGDLRWPARAGFDIYTGYGRVHAQRAVEAARAGHIPPRVDLTSPDWFAIVSPLQKPRLAVTATIELPRATSATWVLEFALGPEPTEGNYQRVAAGEVRGSRSGLLGTLDFTQLPRPAGPPPRHREERDRYSVTLRLRVTDASGRIAEARRAFFLFDDPTWKAGFPLYLGASGEASPLLHDLDGDGRAEIILPTADGVVRVIHVDAGGVRSVRWPLDRGPRVDPQAPEGWHTDELRRSTIIRGAAVGGLDGRGKDSVVVASRDGQVYAFDARGQRRRGFPIGLNPALALPVTRDQEIDSGILTRPVLADLDGRPGLEIVVAALDGHIYVWRHDGSLLPGFPVALEDPRRGPGHRAKLVSTPAVGDLDGDGIPEIVVGSNGVNRDLAAVYAVRSRGTLHPQGAFVPGWQPFEVSALRPDLLPTLASGVSMRPGLVDVDGDGDLEVVLYAATGGEIVLVDQSRAGAARVAARMALTPAKRSEFRDTAFLGGTGSPLIADTDGDGRAELYVPLLPFRMLTLRARPGVPLEVPLALGGWELTLPAEGREIPMQPTWPRRMEDLMIFAAPAAIDVDGDGRREILMGSGGWLLHAFRRDDGEAATFPKFTGGWIFSTPQAGDIDGDGRDDLVAVTREGYLFAWELEPSATTVVGSASSEGAGVVDGAAGAGANSTSR